MKVKIKNIIFLFLTFFFFFFIMVICKNNQTDQVWEYGFAHNILTGLLPYKDFNMIVFPLHAYISAFVLKIFGDKYIIYLFFHAIIMTFIAYLIHKKSKHFYQSFIPIFLLTIVSFATYNTLLLFLFYILLLLEEEKKNDYVIGIMLAFLILTKQTVGVCFIIPTLFLKEKTKIKNRLIPIFIIGIIYISYLLFTNSFYDCINYTILNLFEFSSYNGTFNFLSLFYIFYFILLLKKYKDTKEIKYLYYIAFSTIAIPLFDFWHFIYAVIPFISDVYSKKELKQKSSILLFSIGILCALICTTFLFFRDENTFKREMDKNNLFYLSSLKIGEIDKVSQIIFNYYQKEKNPIYIIGDDSYFFHLDHKIPIDKMTLILYGNNGYKGNENLKKKIDSMDKNTIFIIEKVKSSAQHNTEIEQYIINQCIKLTDLYGNQVQVYQKK